MTIPEEWLLVMEHRPDLREAIVRAYRSLQEQEGRDIVWMERFWNSDPGALVEVPPPVSARRRAAEYWPGAADLPDGTPRRMYAEPKWRSGRRVPRRPTLEDHDNRTGAYSVFHMASKRRVA